VSLPTRTKLAKVTDICASTVYQTREVSAKTQKPLVRNEINVKIGWCWDGRIEIRLGDDTNGYLEETVTAVAQIVPLVAGGDCSFLPGIVLRALAHPGTEGARQAAALPTAEDRRPSDLPALWRAPCDASRHGRAVRVRVPSLRQLRGSAEGSRSMNCRRLLLNHERQWQISFQS
jgi:hypothetical protein